MNLKTTVWSEGDWGLWRHNTMKSDRGSWGKYMLFHTCGDTRHPEHRVMRFSDPIPPQAIIFSTAYVCVVCHHEAPDGAVALLHLMNWEEE